MSNADTPTVSVVVPVYNGAETVRRTVASVLDQTFEDFELLIIDDGSTDTTTDIIDRFDDPRVKLHSFENKGLAASRNRGIHRASGKYVAFLDADDLWTNDKLVEQVAVLEAKPELGLAYSLTDCIDEQDNYIGRGSHIVESGNVFNRLLIWNFLDNGSTPVIRRQVFEDVGIFDETLAAAEDWDLWLRIAYRYEFGCVPKPQVLYRIHGGAMSSNLERQEKACFRVFDAAVSRVPPGPEHDQLLRQGHANLNRYFAGRLITTAADRRSILPAFRYLWRWVRLDTKRRSILWMATVTLGKGLVLLILPHSLARPCMDWLDRIRRKVKARVAG